mmetsp:Transcript_2952/g.6950  ORF Transcript_2952/g.6950 Transcript_2952/m.6950 type:complete len:248 (-) Transcript_2952:108-851(-)
MVPTRALLVLHCLAQCHRTEQLSPKLISQPSRTQRALMVSVTPSMHSSVRRASPADADADAEDAAMTPEEEEAVTESAEAGQPEERPEAEQLEVERRHAEQADAEAKQSDAEADAEGEHDSGILHVAAGAEALISASAEEFAPVEHSSSSTTSKALVLAAVNPTDQPVDASAAVLQSTAPPRQADGQSSEVEHETSGMELSTAADAPQSDAPQAALPIGVRAVSSPAYEKEAIPAEDQSVTKMDVGP